MIESFNLDTEVPQQLTKQDITTLFPPKVRKSAEDYVEDTPREKINFQKVKYIPNKIGLNNFEIWRFSNIQINQNEASYIDLPPFKIEVDYFGGPEDKRLLYELIKILGEPKRGQNNIGFRLFFNKILIGTMGQKYPETYDKASDKFKPTLQLELLKKAVRNNGKPILVLLGHGGKSNHKEDINQKTIGAKDGTHRVSIAQYLSVNSLTNYSAIIDLSCTVNPDYCLTILPNVLSKDCPIFFGSLQPIDEGLGLNTSDTYIIENGRATIFRK